MKALLRLLPLVTVMSLGLPAQAEPVHFRLSGSQGNGLLPGNGVGGPGFANAKDQSPQPLLRTREPALGL